METKTFVDHILNGGNGVELLAFTFFTIFGLLLIKIIRYKRKQTALAAAKPPVKIKFNGTEWIYNNGLDFVIALMLAFACYVFFPEALHFLNLPEAGEKMAYGLALGLGLQYVTHLIFNKVNFRPHVHDENCNH